MSRGMPLRLRDYLGHVTEAIANIEVYTSGVTQAAFLADRKTQDAVIRNIEVIGEACNSVTKHHAAFAAAHTEVPWAVAYEMRNALAHGYFKVDQVIVWRTLKVDLPQLKLSIEALLASPNLP